MGNVRRTRKKYHGPAHPWQANRIEKERGLVATYGLKNKEEIWKMESFLKKFARNVKRLIAAHTTQAEIEKKQLMAKVSSIGLLGAGAKLEDVLDLRIENILDRRLQTLVYRKGLARSIKAARQFITHNHITVGERSITFPSYIVTAIEEPTISFTPTSLFRNPEHPEQIPITKKQKKRPITEPKYKRGRR